MKAIRILIFSLLAISLLSCKTQKVVTDSQREINVKTDSTISQKNTIDLAKKSESKIDSSGAKVVVENTETTYYSKPDSSGKQSIVKVEKKSINSVELAKKHETISNKLDSIISNSLVKRSETDLKINERTKVKQTNYSTLYTIISVLILVVIIIVWFWLKTLRWK